MPQIYDFFLKPKRQNGKNVGQIVKNNLFPPFG